MSPRKRFDVGDAALAAQLFGQQNKHLKLIEKKLGIRLGSQGTVLHLSGEPAQVQVAYRLLEELCALLADDMPLYPADIDYAVRILSEDSSVCLKDIFFDTVFVSARNKLIAPKSLNQKNYIDQIRQNHVVFGIGPAGTGKTYLAMAMGVAALMRKEVSRIMLVRPAVEAGEKLVFCPGTWRKRSIRTCDRFMMRCMICLISTRPEALSKPVWWRLRRWPLCVVVR